MFIYLQHLKLCNRAVPLVTEIQTKMNELFRLHLVRTYLRMVAMCLCKAQICTPSSCNMRRKVR